MPKYWGKQIFSLGSFPEVGQKQKMEGKKGKKTETPPRVAHTKPPRPICDKRVLEYWNFNIRKPLFTSKWGRISPAIYWESNQGCNPAKNYP